MKEIIIGTQNPARVKQLRSALAFVAVKLLTFSDLNKKHIDVAEDGITPSENARKKATTIAKTLGKPALAMDSALYFDADNFPEEKQPGLEVRRIKGKKNRPTDGELLEYFTALVQEFADEKGQLRGHWDSAVCVAMPGGKVFETTLLSPRIFVSKPCQQMIPGYPLEAIQIDPESGKYIAEMTTEEQAAFWQKTIGEALSHFMAEVLVKI
jgi:inosine/xanthosine triphosphate pyrophosphatase family protein